MFYLRQLLAYFLAARVQVGGAGHVATGGQQEQQQLQQDAQHLVGGTAHHREQREQQERLWAEHESGNYKCIFKACPAGYKLQSN